MPICIEIGSFVFEVPYSIYKFVTDERTDGWTTVSISLFRIQQHIVQ